MPPSGAGPIRDPSMDVSSYEALAVPRGRPPLFGPALPDQRYDCMGGRASIPSVAQAASRGAAFSVPEEGPGAAPRPSPVDGDHPETSNPPFGYGRPYGRLSASRRGTGLRRAVFLVRSFICGRGQAHAGAGSEERG